MKQRSGKMTVFLCVVTIMASCTKENTFNNGGNLKKEYVDLGLPSGTLWATENVGARYSGNVGDFFAWGETEPKNQYLWSNYKFNDNSYCPMKYTTYESCGSESDNLSTLQTIDDAASVNWGSEWCIPSIAQWEELRDNTTSTAQSLGRLFIGPNGNSIFLPFNGTYCYSYYWTSSLFIPDVGGQNFQSSQAYAFYFDEKEIEEDRVTIKSRSLGFSIRPVRRTH